MPSSDWTIIIVAAILSIAVHSGYRATKGQKLAGWQSLIVAIGSYWTGAIAWAFASIYREQQAQLLSHSWWRIIGALLALWGGGIATLFLIGFAFRRARRDPQTIETGGEHAVAASSVHQPKRIVTVSSAVIMGAVLLVGAGSFGLYGYTRSVANLQRLELIDRCQRMGTRFADEIRRTDRETGIPLENRQFTYRSHYNTVEGKCFVLTEGGMTLPFGPPDYMWTTQVWDVGAGVGATSFAEKDLPVGDRLHYWRGKTELSNNTESAKWFGDLMVQ